MHIGYAVADITPAVGLTLSGFASRCDRPAEAVDDPLEVHVLIADSGEGPVLLAVFDLLALGADVTEALHQALDNATAVQRERRILACTHTHSAPAAITLLGCGLMNPAYLQMVIERTTSAVREAAATMRPATMRVAIAPVTGVSYYRRTLQAEGGVNMAVNAEGIRGPTWDTMRLVRVDDDAGQPIVTILHWACHPVTRGALAVTADLPGAIRRQFTATHGLPACFFQGAAGDINPTAFGQSREQLQALADDIVGQLGDIAWSAPIADPRCAVVTRTVNIGYERSLPVPELDAWATGMRAIAETGEGPADAAALLHAFFGTRAGEAFEPRHQHIARAMADWAEISSKRLQTEPVPTCAARLSAWRLGPIAWCVIPAETFVETAFALREALPNEMVEVIAYAAPLIGYLPTDTAIDQGGYEAADAYRYYAHPAVFAKGSEPAIRAALLEMLSTM